MRRSFVWIAVLSMLPALALGEQTPQQAAPAPAAPPEGMPQETTPPAETAESDPARGPFDAGQVEAFFDGFMHAALADHDVAGATLSVVRDGQVLLAKGYGYDDTEVRRKVDAERSLFRIGSISKTFTWTAIMQLVEQGRLDLRADVNDYIEHFEVPEAFGSPITLENLLSHSAGFEDQVLGLFARDASSLAPLGEVLARELPARVRPPGTVSSYSNHGTGIAGYIVEQVSGMSFDDYVEQRILEPLGMIHTTFRQPIPEALPARMSKGYRWAGDWLEEPFEYVPLAPVGAASSSAADMARYMIAHLQLGELEGIRILGEATARQMQSELFRHAEYMNPMAHGFYDTSRNGERVIGHGGDTLWFHSEMALLPERGVGLFVSTNSARGNAVAGLAVDAFMDAYYPVDEPEAVAPPESGADLTRFVGSYRANRYSHRTLAKLSALSPVSVSATDDGALRVSATGTTRWIEVAPLTFREERGERHIAFREDADGNVTHMFFSQAPVIAFDRLGFWGNPQLHMGVALFALVMQVGVLLLWPLAGFIRYRHRYVFEKALPLLSRVVAWIASLLTVAFLLLLAVVVSDPNEIVFGIPTLLTVALTLPLIAAPLAFAMLGLAAMHWRDKKGSLTVRVVYTALALSFVGSYWLLWYWNLLGYQY